MRACPHCGEDAEESATTCPHCRRPLQRLESPLLPAPETAPRSPMAILTAVLGLILCFTPLAPIGFVMVWLGSVFALRGSTIKRFGVGFVTADVVLLAGMGFQAGRPPSSGSRSSAAASDDNAGILRRAVQGVDYPCDDVVRTFHRGSRDGDDFWSLTCANGRSYRSAEAKLGSVPGPHLRDRDVDHARRLLFGVQAVTPSSRSSALVALSLEEGLRRAEDRAALLRYTLDLAAASAEVPEPPVLSGLADLCGDLEDTVRQVGQAIDAEALGQDLASERDDDDQSPALFREQQTHERRWKYSRRRSRRSRT
jgi:hypothetical protein